MKRQLNYLGDISWLFALLLTLSTGSAKAQAPASIATETLGMEITSGSYPLASSGYFLFLPSNAGNGYGIIGIANVNASTGTYSYSPSGAIASVGFSDSGGGAISGSFDFSAATSGSYSLSDLTYGGNQSGDFVMFTNPAPNSINGANFYVNAQAGNGVFVSSGGSVFTAAASGNTYTITAISAGVANSHGTYSYSKPNATCGVIQLSDAVEGASTGYLAFTNPVSGEYLAAQPSTGSSQVGNLALLTAQAPPDLAGGTFIAAVSSGTPPLAGSGYFLVVFANAGDSYQIIGLDNVTNSSGTYSYSHSGAAGTTTFSDSLNGLINGSFFYFTPLSGSYASSAGTLNQYTQTGDFAILTNPVPDSIAGQGFYITVTNGALPYAASGGFTFSAAASGNDYTITTISGGGLNSTGTYAYSKLNSSCGGIQLTDSVAGVSTAYLAFSNSIAGNYILTQPSTGGYQVGLMTALNTKIAIASPTTAPGYTTSSSSVNLSGTASDTLGIARVSWSNNRGGSGTAAGNGGWTANGIGLQNGTNIIIVTAWDTVSNTAQTVLSVIYNQPDTTPPSISITSPTTGALDLTNVGTINLGGTASDNVAVTLVTWSNNRGGSGSATGTAAWSIAGVALQSGTNVITVTAHDAAGNSDRVALTVIYTTTPPTLIITSPTTAPIDTNYVGSINLAGAATDSAGISLVTWSNNRGGNGIATGTGVWSIMGLVLQTGTNIVTLVAHDNAGNTSQTAITVIYTVPTLDFQSAGNRIVLSWPTNATGFGLQNSASLSATSVWSSASSPGVVGSNYVVTNIITSSSRFYRLIK